MKKLTITDYAKYIILKHEAYNHTQTTKLLYFTFVNIYKETGQQPFICSFEAWIGGAVDYSCYKLVRDYQTDDIPLEVIKMDVEKLDFDPVVTNEIDHLWEKYKAWDQWHICKIRELAVKDSAWKKQNKIQTKKHKKELHLSRSAIPLKYILEGDDIY